MQKLFMDINSSAPVITHDEIVINSSLRKVWNLFTDISRWSEWNKDIASSSVQSPLDIGTVFNWSTAGMNISSTIGEFIPLQRIAWSGLVQGIMGIHVWSFNTIEHGVLVKTHES